MSLILRSWLLIICSASPWQCAQPLLLLSSLRQDNNIVKYLVIKQKEIVPKQIHRPRQAFYEPLYDNGGYDMLTRGSELDLRVAGGLSGCRRFHAISLW